MGNLLKYSTNKDSFFFFEAAQDEQKCQLKNFLHFLASQKEKRPYKFSFVEKEAPLINTLTIRENVNLGSTANFHSNSHESEIEKLINNSGNQHLSHFFREIPQLDEAPINVNDQTRKMAALLKGLIQKTDYLFLESPEKYLSQKNLEIFIKAVLYKVHSEGLIVFVQSPKRHIWSPYINKAICRDKRQNFLIQDMANSSELRERVKKVS